MKAGAYDPADKQDKDKPNPPTDLEYKTVSSFASEGEKVAGTTEGQVYDLASRTWRPHIIAGYFDGKTGRAFLPPDRPGWGRVAIRSGNDYRLASGLYTVSNTPVLYFYRPLGDGTAFPTFDALKPRLTGRTEKEGGVACAEIAFKDMPPGSTRTLWCDPERGYLPIREEHRKGFGEYDQNFVYRNDPKRGWV